MPKGKTMQEKSRKATAATDATPLPNHAFSQSTKRGLRLLTCGVSLLMAAACGKPGGLAPDGSDLESVDPGAAGSSGTNSPDTSSGGTSSRNPTDSRADNAPDVEDPTETLPDEELPAGPPAGCVEAYTGSELVLTLSDTIASARIEAREGELYANDVACTDEVGRPVAIDTIQNIRIAGSEADDVVVLDLGSGTWLGLLSSPGSMSFQLAGGSDSVTLVTGAEDDLIRHAMLDGSVVLDLNADGEVDFTAESAEKLGLSLGAGNDRVEDLWSWLQEELDEQDERLSEAWGSLSIPLLAYGAEGNDQILGGSADDWLGGGPGDDVLNGLGGSDQFTGAPDADGKDTINGGPDFDLISYAQRTENLTLNLCVSTALTGCASDECSCDPSGEVDELDLLVNIEGIRSGSGDDVINGGDVAESLIGGAGDDRIYGHAGSDVLLGQQGYDHLEGGADEDICDRESAEEDLGCEL